MKFIIILISLYFSEALCNMNSPNEFIIKDSITAEAVNTNFFVSSASFYLKFYQNYISPINGESCQMIPSCSEYSLQSIKTHGILGLLMTTDRLHRCGHDLFNYHTIIFGNSIKFYDPVLE